MNFQSPFLKKYFQLLKFLALPFFFFLLATTHLDQILSESIETQLRSSSGAPHQVWFFAALSLLLSLFSSWLLQIMGLLAYSFTETRKNPAEFFKQNFEQLIIESLRAWGKTTLYSLFLILPGLWKFFQYQFVPWVVCLSKNYHSGLVDALHESESLFSKSKTKIILLSLAFLILWPLLTSSIFASDQLFWINPAKSIFYHILETLFHVLFIQIMTKIFVALLKESQDEPIF